MYDKAACNRPGPNEPAFEKNTVATVPCLNCKSWEKLKIKEADPQ